MQPQDQLIVALDLPNAAPALAVVNTLGETILWYKVGLELYLAEGQPIVHALKQRGKQVFLDLKLHDIPNTVASAARIAAATGADLLTVHAAGGPAMLRAAVEAARSSSLQILAVTVLTSMDSAELHAVGVPADPATQVSGLANLALQTGVQGLICSSLEVSALRQNHGPDPLLVVPGIRSSEDDPGDQQRTSSATKAISNGASKLVVGRPITRAADPLRAAQRLLDEITTAQGG